MVLWIAMSAKEFYVLFYPPACKLRQGCYHPRLPWGARVDITAHMGEGAIRAAVWNVTNVSSVEELEAAITTPVPPSVRRGEMRELWLTFELSRTGSDDVLSAARVNIVQMYEARERSQASMLLERDVFGDVFASSDEKPAVTEAPSTSSTVSAELAPADRHGRVPHFIYSYRMCELRLVTDARAYASPFLAPDGTPIGQSWDVHARTAPLSQRIACESEPAWPVLSHATRMVPVMMPDELMLSAMDHTESPGLPNAGTGSTSSTSLTQRAARRAPPSP